MTAVRHAMSTLRYRWLDVRIGGPAATMRGQWRVVIGATLLVFGCFFAIGRLSSTSGSAQISATATEAPSSRPAVPAGLSGGPPTAGAVPTAIIARPTPAPSATKAAADASPTTTVVPSAVQPTTLTQSTPRAAPVSSPTPANKPAPASATEQTSPKTGGTGSGSSTASPKPASSHSTPSSGSSENGSFDSSE
jgi:trimeric autotransporter adhesin